MISRTSTGNNISHINMIQLLHMLTHTSCIFLYTLCPNLEIEIIKKKPKYMTGHLEERAELKDLNRNG